MSSPPQIFRRTLRVAVLAGLAAAAQAQATAISFDDLSGNLGAAGATYGVQFQHSSGNQYLLNGADYVPNYSAGSFLGYYALTESFEIMSLPAGVLSAFALSSLDLIGAAYFQANETRSLTITGIRTNGTVVTSGLLTVSQGQVASYGPAAFAGFTGLQSIRVSGVDGSRAVYVGLDNINIAITAVPEPETLAMLLAGLGLVGWTARRRAVQS